MTKFFKILIDHQLKHPVVALLAALLLSVLAIGYTFANLGFQTSQMDLIYPKNRLVTLSRGISAFNEYDTFVVVIQNPGNAPRCLSFLHALAARLGRDKKHYRQIFYRVDPAHFKPWALLYMKQKDLVGLEQNLREHKRLIRRLMRATDLTAVLGDINHEMASSMVGALFTGFLEAPGEKKKPLDLTPVIRVLTQMQHGLEGGGHFVSPWTSVFTGTAWDENADEGYFWTRQKRFLLLFVTPRATGSGFSDTLNSLKSLRRSISRVQRAFPGIQAGVTGQEALNEDEMGTALHDISIATILSLAGLAILLTLFWRGIRRPLLELTELVVALSWTFGLTTLFIGHLNILSITFAPLLLGLGIDYGIHWLARYQEEVQQMGLSKEAAIRATMLKLGPSILLAGLTAAISFFPLVLTGFKGLVELGEITSMGMIMTTVTTLCLLPALVMLFDRAATAGVPAVEGRRPQILFRLNSSGAATILVMAGLAFAFSVQGTRHVAFDLNMLHLQSKGAQSVIWEHKLLDGSDRSSMYGAMLAGSLEEIRKKTRALKALPTVSEVQSVLSMLPEHQKDKIRLLYEMKPFIAGNGALKISDKPIDIVRLSNILGRIRFKMTDTEASDWGPAKPLAIQMRRVRDLIDGLRERFHSMDAGKLRRSLDAFDIKFMEDLQDKLKVLRMNVNATPMQARDLPLSLRERYISRDGRYLLRIFPSGNIWQPAFLSRFVHDLRSVDPNAIGDPVTLDIFTRAFRNACFKAAVYAVVFIALLLLFTFRNVLQAFLVMTPLIMGTAWTLGLMALFGVDFNLANSIFLPLVIGAGVEYGIIIMQRRKQQETSDGAIAIPVSTAKGVILAGLTTTVGFGSLIISHHRGIASLGLLATIGSLCMLTAAVIFLPALMQLVRRFLDKG